MYVYVCICMHVCIYVALARVAHNITVYYKIFILMILRIIIAKIMRINIIFITKRALLTGVGALVGFGVGALV
jgi:hypothetical protein